MNDPALHTASAAMTDVALALRLEAVATVHHSATTVTTTDPDNATNATARLHTHLSHRAQLAAAAHLADNNTTAVQTAPILVQASKPVANKKLARGMCKWATGLKMRIPRRRWRG